MAERVARGEAERARAELAELNQGLQQHVAEKVTEVERLSNLRRLLSPHLAEAVLTSDELLKPHRREIAVVFVDLRGFTGFASSCEPEEVIEVLEEFYGVLGDLFQKFGATVGYFEGDGVMAYFNDPVPTPQPALKAVELVLELRVAMRGLLARWSDRGFELGYGAGVALGYATLGMVGFDERQDYMALGNVVNLASRLCDEAGNEEVLLDRRTAAAVRELIELEEVELLDVKGFRGPTRAFKAGLTKQTPRQLRSVPPPEEDAQEELLGGA